ncbi:MAG: NAD(P)H-hydrate dehydratase [Gemmatimonadota bacterium]|nr:NAD(P)H-hydrate dehydratase [Gemmatimonadota bacterium]
MPVSVTTAAEAAARDREAIDAGTPEAELMRRAGAGAAAEIARRYPSLARGRVAILTGPGNNGGDGWIVAGELANSGASVRVTELSEPRSATARAARDRALSRVEVGSFEPAPLVVDALVGTGARGGVEGELARLISAVRSARASGAAVVSLDVPSGLDATTGEGRLCVIADLTITFATLKRGLLAKRECAGAIVVVDIGLGQGDRAVTPHLVDAAWVHARVPGIAPDSHKGTRRKLLIVGGQRGMAGATIIAARAALRSGIGMVRALVDDDSVSALQAAAPQAMAASWRELDSADGASSALEWADVVLMGPGLGRSTERREMVERVLEAGRKPMILDADALTLFTGRPTRLGELLGARPALLTPHPVEFGLLAGIPLPDVVNGRYEVGQELARTVRSVVLLKGVPTVITSPTGGRMVSASGTPALATAGSGDMLAGIAATLLGQMDDPLDAAACAAWVHGRAAELAQGARRPRGVTLGDVNESLGEVWSERVSEHPAGVLAELPALRS